MPEDQKAKKQSPAADEKMQGLEGADPHPAEEGDPYNSRGPRAHRRPTPDIGPNPSAHDGTPPRRPSNKESRPDQKDVEPRSDAAADDEALGVGPIDDPDA